MKELVALIVKKLHGEMSEAEEKELEEYVSRSSKHKEIYDHVTNIGFMEIFLFDETMSNEEFQKYLIRLHDKHERNKERAAIFRRLTYVWIAACLVGVIVYFFNYNVSLYRSQDEFDVHGKWIGLRQWDGTIILVDSTKDRLLPNQGDYRLTVREDELIYTPLRVGSSSTTRHFFNSLLLPVGRHFKVTLPDGSKVCLNAASSIKFPVSDAGSLRTLELMGEALFSIVSDSTRPFNEHFDTILNAICAYSKCYIAKRENRQLWLKKNR